MKAVKVYLLKPVNEKLINNTFDKFYILEYI